MSSETIITDAQVFIDNELKHAELLIAEGVIANVAKHVSRDEHPAAQVISYPDCVVSPGLIDVHFHGCMGFDFCDGTLKALHEIARFEASRGITAICPATMTFTEKKLTGIMQNAHDFVPESNESDLVGINMEGPFISPHKVGAQNPEFVQQANIDMLRRLQEVSGGLIKLVDVAPEVDGTIHFIQELSDEVRICVAHTCATYDEAVSALKAGARQLTHLYNAMPALHHRNPGPIPAFVEAEGTTAEIITDGVHIHPAMVRLAFKMFGPERMILISDSMMAAGMPDGTYELGGQEVQVSAGKATLADGTIAGSATDLATCLKRAITQMDIAPVDALRAATINPASAIGIEDTHGSITTGRSADLVIFNPSWDIEDVYLRGQRLSDC